jgi:uncharacterized protein YdeI (YjbR/CyaY-like superfamily)
MDAPDVILGPWKLIETVGPVTTSFPLSTPVPNSRSLSFPIPFSRFPISNMARSFRTQKAFRDWLTRNHDKEKELMLLLFKVHAKHRGIGYREALDEALCFGWIDGVLRRVDDDSHLQRFTPRRAKSNWSKVNIKRFKELQAEGRVHPAGLAAFNAWNGKAAPYSFQSKPEELDAAFIKRLKANKPAWAYYQTLPPYYKRVTSFWIMSAKRPETRAARFATMLKFSALGRRIPLLASDRKE